MLSGAVDAPVLRQLWELGESWWHHNTAVDWSPTTVPAAPDVLDAELLLTMRAAVAAQPIIPTISDGRPNCWIEEVTPDGVWVETERSRQLGGPAQLVPAWMIQVAWEYLASHGTLTNRYLLADGLNVKRSSFVCALLATLPDVTVTSRRPIELRLPG